jgi:hypothetical protein
MPMAGQTVVVRDVVVVVVRVVVVGGVVPELPPRQALKVRAVTAVKSGARFRILAT